MNRDHYDRVEPGQWTFNAIATHMPIVFRKGSDSDSVLHGYATVTEGRADDWLVGSSEWGWTNDALLAAVLDVLNAHEAEHGRIEA